MKQTRLLRFAPCLCLLGLFLLGVALKVRHGVGLETHHIHVHVDHITEQGSTIHCSWKLTGTEPWSAFIGAGDSNPGYAAVIGLDQQAWNPFTSNSSETHVDLTVTSGPKTAPGLYSCTESIRITLSGGRSMIDSGGNYSCHTSNIHNLVVPLIDHDTSIVAPGRVVLATIDGKPLALEFRK